MSRNSSSLGSAIGCLLLIVLFVISSIVQWLQTNPGAWIALIILILGIAVVIYQSRKARMQSHIEYFEELAKDVDVLAAAKPFDLSFGIALNKDEVPLWECTNVQLVEYRSNGSTYSGASLGVSFPLVGNLRGYAGGNQGEIIKNPAVQTVVDTGKAIFTNQRIVFTGSMNVRDWDFKKILNLQPSDNGFSVQIAVSNRPTTSGLQLAKIEGMGPGIAAGFALTYCQEGKAAAQKWAKDLAVNMRKLASDARAKEKSHEPEAPNPTYIEPGKEIK